MKISRAKLKPNGAMRGSKNRGKVFLWRGVWALMGDFEALLGASGRHWTSWGLGGPPGVRRFGGSWRPLGALLAPSWPSKSILDGQRIGSNLDQNFEALQDRCWKPLRRILGGKMEACWHLKSMKNRCHLREAIFYQSVVFPRRESKF